MKFFIYKELHRIRKTLEKIEEQEIIMSQAVDTLTEEVAETNGIMQSAIVLLEGLAVYLQEIAGDPEAILALSEELSAKSDALSAAVAAVPPVTPPTP